MIGDKAERQLHGSPSKNVFRRLSTSPIKKSPVNTNKSAMRLSPVRPRRNWDQTMSFQTTPKRLQSPPYLQDFKNAAGTVSVDRVHFNNNPDDTSIQLSFPTSPVKARYSNAIAPGGDGSLSRIRARFGGGQRSPQKSLNSRSTATTVTDLAPMPTRNLLPKLKEQDEGGLITSNKDAIHLDATTNNTKLNSAPVDDSERDGFRIRKPKLLSRKKSVKFKSLGGEGDVRDQLSDITAMLSKIIQRQDQLEAKIDSIERG
ncbi:LANO_0C07206g1_1 [Lachancea nothofagi CBS 11611]|uniref:LANO_0C07206g1_1 n=1 Tax=Lachancea nothofagi CBS 11611 TaxID=1266666 RepID=A0A1G4J8E4_9SACH|nr:LANO_0C07206g1_1 [Lachancea nothofagi CBS 11611]